jgi:hypothetical protein
MRRTVLTFTLALSVTVAGDGEINAAAQASTSVSAASAAETQEWPSPSPGQDKPANWNRMDAQQQAYGRLTINRFAYQVSNATIVAWLTGVCVTR